MPRVSANNNKRKLEEDGPNNANNVIPTTSSTDAITTTNESAVRSSKRTRTQPVILDNSTTITETKKKVVSQDGKGKALKDIPQVAKILLTYPAASYHYYLQSLHDVLYSCSGSNTSRRLAILRFNGFPIEVTREQKYRQLIKNTKYTAGRGKMLRTFCDMLALNHQGNTEELIERLLDFLFCPKLKKVFVCFISCRN